MVVGARQVNYVVIFFNFYHTVYAGVKVSFLKD